ncbi:VWA domain-containing protein [Streptomyces malaysiensis]|uniref:VWA domain-containing protein n=1 Tax=Streptomyces malaysiensis TaxID=92644 RepID=UPI001F3A717D|nr:VWA domain-containing protein [Streptomyces autolyticus]
MRARAFRVGTLTAVLLLVISVVPGAAAGKRAAAARPAVTPAVVDEPLDPGDALTVDKKVRTPVVPPRPDVVLLVDGTGSMQPTIDNVQANLEQITSRVREQQPDSRFAVATYGDQQVDGERVFTVLQTLTDNLEDVQKGVDQLTDDRGSYSPGPAEDWINGLWQIANGAGGAFREGASPVVVLVGDASSHDPSKGHSLTDGINALKDAGVRVLAVDVATELGDGLNGNGDNGNGPGQNQEPTHDPDQATKVVQATGGRLFQDIDSGEVADTVAEGLTNLPTTVSYQTFGCDPALSVTLDPATRQVTSGEVATFTETITVADDAPQGATVHCGVQFLLDGKPPSGQMPDDVVPAREFRGGGRGNGNDTGGSGTDGPGSGPGSDPGSHSSSGSGSDGGGGSIAGAIGGAVGGTDGGGNGGLIGGAAGGVSSGSDSCGGGSIAGLAVGGAGGWDGGGDGGVIAGVLGGLIGGSGGDCGGTANGGSGAGGSGSDGGSVAGAIGGVIGGADGGQNAGAIGGLLGGATSGSGGEIGGQQNGGQNGGGQQNGGQNGGDQNGGQNGGDQNGGQQNGGQNGGDQNGGQQNGGQNGGDQNGGQQNGGQNGGPGGGDGGDEPTPEDYQQRISITVNDVTAPVVTVDDRTIEATDDNGTEVDFTATAQDAVDGDLPVSCDPPPGSRFPVGRTRVSCTATDSSGNTGTDTATFTVRPAPVPNEADLAVTTAVGPTPAYTGQRTGARLTLTNAGPKAARNVVVTTAWPRTKDTGDRDLSGLSRCTRAAPCTIAPGGRITVTQTAEYRTAIRGELKVSVSGSPRDPRRADNTDTARVRVLKPKLTVTPEVARPGDVTIARGKDFPPGVTVALSWDPGVTAARSTVRVGRGGTFEAQMLVLPKDRLGPRELRATVTGLERLDEPMLVVRRNLQPPDFAGRG